MFELPLKVSLLARWRDVPFFYYEERFANHSIEEARDDLRLPDGLIADVTTWDAEYQDTYDPDGYIWSKGGFPSPEAEKAWLEHGKVLAARILAESPVIASVDYRANGVIDKGACLFGRRQRPLDQLYPPSRKPDTARSIDVSLLTGWQEDPFYYHPEEDRLNNHTIREAQRDLRLPDGLVADLTAWDAEYQDTYRPDDPRNSGFPSEEAEAAWVERGKTLAARIKAESPVALKIDYLADYAFTRNAYLY
ncbi:hypothetical protein FHR81_004203 [Actinoalloteichus hoggarensis]|uniref:Uncharacterized protein n=1 Tax=Actinoalloteichus hoggarensis TaxID=1470176 RepID=A0A221W8U7_9PSEU|nr:hypothetical protein [Actinoalloteichus hoggarensis]ASO22440.1 hypothetical protein AHOG_24170 [Actinoalloteichus hoggarensis]MBB5923136.1 hypothetical protein [Actinoalloteichus hoggarensis]